MLAEEPNLVQIELIAGEDKDFRQTLIDIIKKELPQETNDYRTNLKDENFKMAAEHVHKLKHKIGIFGLENGYKMASSYETELKQGSKSLEPEFEALLVTMATFVNTL